MVLWLVGMMGSGKSTVGEEVAAALDLDFIDTDQLVAAVSEHSIPDLWQEQGEDVFRALEKQMIASAADSGPAVVATGGGAVVDPENVAVMRASGQVIWLTASPGTLDARVGRLGGRPLLAEGTPRERLGALLAERETAYAGAAHAEISTDGRDVADVVADVLAQWHAFR